MKFLIVKSFVLHFLRATLHVSGRPNESRRGRHVSRATGPPGTTPALGSRVRAKKKGCEGVRVGNSWFSKRVLDPPIIAFYSYDLVTAFRLPTGSFGRLIVFGPVHPGPFLLVLHMGRLDTHGVTPGSTSRPEEKGR